MPLRTVDAALQKPVQLLFSLVANINQRQKPRSENELSRRLADVLEALRLSTVVDTSPRGTKKRPDILAYQTERDANLALPADVVVEAKLPAELSGMSITDALADHLWQTKTFPYISKNISRIQYYILTTFVDYACLRITDEIRAAVSAALARGDDGGESVKSLVRSQVECFSLAQTGLSENRTAESQWLAWFDLHLRHVARVPLSTIANTKSLKTRADLEEFADGLATIAAGPVDLNGVRSSAGFFYSLRAVVLRNQTVSVSMEKELRLFVMALNPSIDASEAAKLISDDRVGWLDEFVGASIHSLVSRLFAIKAIEDIYCVGKTDPLVEQSLWVMHGDSTDALSPEGLHVEIASRMRRLSTSKNSVVRRISLFGSFFDSLHKLIDPVDFRALFELFIIHDFRELEGDLLGRFFEVYSQRMNRVNRRELGQYYTPLPVIRFMWSLAMEELRVRRLVERVTVLDPSTGSGRFLAEGSRLLANAGIPRFWERLVGFDVSPQVLGIAQINIYMNVLAQIVRQKAPDVDDLSVYTTDALDPRNGRHLEGIAPFVQDEAHVAFIKRSIEVTAEIKQRRRFWLVIGNPPYKNNSRFTLKQMSERFPKLLSASVKAAKAKQRNIRDDYAWFFAAADHYVHGQGQGMIVLITSDSFLRHSSYILFRRELLRNYTVRKIVRLGAGLFQDVGPNISFVVTVLLQRSKPLSVSEISASNDETVVQIFDLRTMCSNRPVSELGTENDPRLLYLDAIARQERTLPSPMLARPANDNGYALVPIVGNLVDRMRRHAVPLAAKTGERIVTKKWPGIITAFDELLKDDQVDRLKQRMSRFLSICQAECRSPSRLTRRLEEFAHEYDISEANVSRLLAVAKNAAELRTQFDPLKIKRSVSGSIPNHLRWYPHPKFRHYVYYEPAIKIERNENRGKLKGWGSMEQWRDPASHLVAPKLIFTTSSNPDYGYKAFVVDDEWYVKSHGGKSQQYHYTSLSLPSQDSAQIQMHSPESNLANAGAKLLHVLTENKCSPSALLHYIAGIYNSRLADTWLRAETGQEIRIRVPEGRREIKTVLEICHRSSELRDLHRLLYDGPSHGRVERDVFDSLASARTAQHLGVERGRDTDSRFRQTDFYVLPVEWTKRLESAIGAHQQALDDDVETLYI